MSIKISKISYVFTFKLNEKKKAPLKNCFGEEGLQENFCWKGLDL